MLKAGGSGEGPKLSWSERIRKMEEAKKEAAEAAKLEQTKLFFDLLAKAAQKCLADIDTLPDITDEKYLQSFENKTLDEYLRYLGPEGIKLLDVGQAATNFGEKSKSPKFFHYFLQEFNRLRTVSSQTSEDQTDLSVAEITGGPSIKDCKRDKTAGKALSLLSGDKYRDDVTGTLDVGGMKFSYSETIGKRSTQEDAFMIGAANSKFSDSSTVPELLRQEFEDLGKRIATSGVIDGSTAILAHYSTDQKLTIANAGDARAILCIKIPQPDGTFKVRIVRATNDNEPNDVFETARIEALGGFVNKDNNRVSDLLMIARSFGDNLYVGRKDTGETTSRLIASEPDIYQYNIRKILSEAGPGSEVFLVTSCDGLYDHNKGNEATYTSIMQDWFNDADLQARWDGNISEYLRDCAIYLESTDNVTVTCTNLTEAPTQAVMVGVFDGHAGNDVARTAALELGRSLLDPDQPKVMHAVAGKSAVSELRTFTAEEAEAEKKRVSSREAVPTPPTPPSIRPSAISSTTIVPSVIASRSIAPEVPSLAAIPVVSTSPAASHSTPARASSVSASKSIAAIPSSRAAISVPPIPKSSFRPMVSYKLNLLPYLKPELLDEYTKAVEDIEGVNSANSRSSVKLAILLTLGYSKEAIFASAMETGERIIINPNHLEQALKELEFQPQDIEKANKAFRGGISLNRADIGVLLGDRRLVDQSDQGEFFNLADSLEGEKTYHNYFKQGGTFDKIKERRLFLKPSG